jgi:hypothetical protein
MSVQEPLLGYGPSSVSIQLDPLPPPASTPLASLAARVSEKAGARESLTQAHFQAAAPLISQYLSPRDVSAMRQAQTAWKKAPMTVHIAPRLLPFLLLLRNKMFPTASGPITPKEMESLCRQIATLHKDLKGTLPNWKKRYEVEKTLETLEALIKKEQNPAVKCHLMCQALLGGVAAASELVTVKTEESIQSNRWLWTLLCAFITTVCVATCILIPPVGLVIAIPAVFAGIFGLFTLGLSRSVYIQHSEFKDQQRQWKLVCKMFESDTLQKITQAAHQYMLRRVDLYNPNSSERLLNYLMFEHRKCPFLRRDAARRTY